MKKITRSGDMPRGEHWAIIKYDTHYTPADARSISAPGHGYPASSDAYAIYYAFDDEADWKENIRECIARNDYYNAMKVIPAKITTKIVVDGDE